MRPRRTVPRPPPKTDDTTPFRVGNVDPTKPAHMEEADVAAVQAILGTPHGQRALEWIVNGVCDTYGLSHRPNDTHATAFAEGKRFVGLQIIKATKLRLDTFRKIKEAAKPAEQKKD